MTGADTRWRLAQAPGTGGPGPAEPHADHTAALKRARHQAAAKAAVIRDALRAGHPGQADIVTSAYAVTVRSAAAILQTLNEQIKTLQGKVEAHCGRQPAAEVYLSQPGMGPMNAARVLAEFGDAKGRYADARARKYYTSTAPIIRRSPFLRQLF